MNKEEALSEVVYPSKPYEVFDALARRARTAGGLGIPTVQNPVAFITARVDGINSRSRALAVLGELRRMGAITLTGRGSDMVATIRVEELEIPLYMEGERDRLVTQLLEWSRPKPEDETVLLVPQGAFRRIRADAELEQGRFYVLLKEFEQGSRIKIVYDPVSRKRPREILHLILTDKMPSQSES